MSASHTDLQENEKVFFILSNSTIASQVEPKTDSFYLAGHLENGNFVIDENKIQGSGTLASSGRPGWLEIGSRQFYSQETARSVTSPYVKGFMTQEGFVPSTPFVQ